MEYNYSFTVDGIEVELSGEDLQELQEGVEESIEFIEDNSELLEGVNSAPVQRVGAAIQSEPPAGQSTPTEPYEFGDISERTQVSPDTLSQIVEIPDTHEESPYLKLYLFDEGAEVLGSSRMDRQARASLILLYIWEEVYGKDEVEGEVLDEALHDSEIDSERRDNMYRALSGDADRYFDRGQGIISLRPPGRQAAREEIQELATHLESV